MPPDAAAAKPPLPPPPPIDWAEMPLELSPVVEMLLRLETLTPDGAAAAAGRSADADRGGCRQADARRDAETAIAAAAADRLREDAVRTQAVGRQTALVSTSTVPALPPPAPLPAMPIAALKSALAEAATAKPPLPPPPPIDCATTAEDVSP